MTTGFLDVAAIGTAFGSFFAIPLLLDFEAANFLYSANVPIGFQAELR
jgi:hypothetical protein